MVHSSALSARLAIFLAWTSSALSGGALAQRDPQDFAAAAAEPLRFIRNAGQFDTPARFVARFPGGLVRVEDRALLVQIYERGNTQRGTLVKMAFEGASENVEVVGEDRTGVVHSYFIGSSPDEWHRDVGSFGTVRLRGLYEGIDLVIREEAGVPKYDVVVAAGADLGRLVLLVEGATVASVDERGDLRLGTASGDLVHHGGRTWQPLPSGSKRSLRSRFRGLDDQRFGFEVPERDPSLTLVIDPGLLWATFLGSPSDTPEDKGRGIAIGPDGDVYATGATADEIFPTTPGAYSLHGPPDPSVFVARFRPADGSLVYSAVLGGYEGHNVPLTIAVDTQQRATIGGWTSAANFPTTSGAPDTFNQLGYIDGFVARLNAAGSDLLYATYLGGANGSEVVYSIAIAPSGAAVACGFTGADYHDFPLTPGAFQAQFSSQGGGSVCFITRLNPTGTGLEWSTLLGLDSCEPSGLALDELEQVTVVSRALGPPYYPATPGAFLSLPTPNNYFNVGISRLSADGSQLLWSSVFGGNLDEEVYGCALDSRGDVYVTGATHSTNFPTTPGTLHTTGFNPGARKAFLSRMHHSGSHLVYSTYLEHQGYSEGHAIAVDPSGVATISGFTASGLFFTPGAFDTVNIGGDAFVSRVDPTGTRLLYSTLFGGSHEEQGWGVALAPNGRVAITGIAYGPGMVTTPGSAQPGYAGGQSDPFVAYFDMLPQGVRSYGRSTGGCRGPLVLQPTRRPNAGAADFGLVCSAAPPNSSGWLLIATQPSGSQGITYQGTRLWLDSTSNVVRQGVTSDDMGYVDIALPTLLTTAGQRVYVQLLMRSTAQCASTAGWCTSNALEITAQ